MYNSNKKNIMILGFTQIIKGKPTHFPEKIISSLIQVAQENNNHLFLADIMRHVYKYCHFFKIDYNDFLERVKVAKPKHHTIREDINERWNDNKLIHFFVNVRTKIMCMFAPIIKVQSTQKIDINWCDNPYNDNLNPVVWIDDLIFYDKEFVHGEDKMCQLAINDGFETTEDFFAYFNENFNGTIIHWTNKRY